MLVIAFDGVLFDSLDARARSVVDALDEYGTKVDLAEARASVVGRTLAEALRALVHAHDEPGRPRRVPDETELDLACLRAGQLYGALVLGGFSLRVSAGALLQRAAAVSRVVVRADSRRREVDALLSVAGLELAVSLTRCSDDPLVPLSTPRRTFAPFTDSLGRSYASIAQRWAGNAKLLGERGPLGIALEASELARRVAVDTGFDAPADFDAVRLPGEDVRLRGQTAPLRGL